MGVGARAQNQTPPVTLRDLSLILGLLHNIGDGCRHTVRAFAPWRSHRRGEIFMTPISRHSDTHRHLATRINFWRHPSPYGDTFPDLATGVAQARQPRELDHILHSVSTGTYAIQEMAGWRNKKGKSGNVATLSSSKMAERASSFPQVAAEVFRLAKQKRLSRYRDVISAVRTLVILVQCKLSRLISPFHDRHGTAILAAVASVVQ